MTSKLARVWMSLLTGVTLSGVAVGEMLPSGRMALGANYWASQAATEMWRKWDAAAVEADLMRAEGQTPVVGLRWWGSARRFCDG